MQLEILQRQELGKKYKKVPSFSLFYLRLGIKMLYFH